MSAQATTPPAKHISKKPRTDDAARSPAAKETRVERKNAMPKTWAEASSADKRCFGMINDNLGRGAGEKKLWESSDIEAAWKEEDGAEKTYQAISQRVSRLGNDIAAARFPKDALGLLCVVKSKIEAAQKVQLWDMISDYLAESSNMYYPPGALKKVFEERINEQGFEELTGTKLPKLPKPFPTTYKKHRYFNDAGALENPDIDARKLKNAHKNMANNNEAKKDAEDNEDGGDLLEDEVLDDNVFN